MGEAKRRQKLLLTGRKMGEAKRRQKLDPNWRMPSTVVKINIDISELTRMYRVIASIQTSWSDDVWTNFVVDSHSLYSDAKKQARIVKPIIQKFSTHDWSHDTRGTVSKVIAELIEVEGLPSKEEMVRGTIGLGYFRTDGNLEIVTTDKEEISGHYESWPDKKCNS